MRLTLFSKRTACQLACLACSLSTVGLLAQDRAAQESRREQWQKVQEIFAEMGIRSGATVADVGAGDGFFTSRLARAVGPDGRVLAVDIDDKVLERLRKRLDDDGIRNVTVIKGAGDDPKLPAAALDSALIVNAYHEIDRYESVLAALRRALKPDGRLVIVEPVSESRRGRPRADQVRAHEIDPEFVLRDARAAGFHIVGLQDPFTKREDDVEWLLALKPAESVPAAIPTTDSKVDAPPAGEQPNAASRVSIEEFRKLVSVGTVSIVDVRGHDIFAAGHIPGAISIPVESVAAAAQQLRRMGKPVVTYCS